MGEASITKTRRDGWTAERQLRFLDALAHRRSITGAAAAAGMSRESAYRVRARTPLFAALWDRALNGTPLSRIKGHEVERVQLPIAPKTGEGHEVEEVEGPLFPPAPPATP